MILNFTNPNVVREYMSKEFDILHFEDLSNITAGPDCLIEVLFKLYKPVFLPNERIIFYTNFYIDKDLLIHVKNICDQVDISPSFILFVCPYDIHKNIDQICSSDDKFDLKLASIKKSDPLSESYKKNSTICPLPWMHLNINNQGLFRPCCQNNQTVGSIHHDEPEDVFHCSKMDEIRDSLNNGQRHNSCQRCWTIEDCGSTSPRQLMLNLYGSIFFNQLKNNPTVTSLDLKLGNACNFKCRICSESASSAIASETLKYEIDDFNIKKIKLIQKNSKWFDSDDIIKLKVLKLLDQIFQLDFYGGEPFLTKNLESVLDYLINSKRSKKIRLHFNTNGSVFPDKLITKLHQFKKVDIAISIDDIGNRFEVTRGGNWEKVLQNIKLFQQLDNKQYNVYIYSTVSILNVYYLDELFNWASKENINIITNFVTEPEYLSIEFLTPMAKKVVLDKYKSAKHPLLQPVVSLVSNSKGSDGKQFVKKMQHLDSIRNQNLRTTHKEITTSMGYV